MRGESFNTSIFWRWYAYAIIGSIIIYWTVSNVLMNELNSLVTYDLWTFGSIIFFIIVFYVNCKIAMETNTHNWMSITLYFFSISSYIFALYYISKSPSMNVFGVWDLFIHTNTLILMLFLILAASLLAEYTYVTLIYIITFVIEKSKTITFKRKERITNESLPIENIAGDKEFAIEINDSINDNTMKSKINENYICSLADNVIESRNRSCKIILIL